MPDDAGKSTIRGIVHEFTVERPSALIRESLAACSCGWKSNWTANSTTAKAAWDRHLVNEEEHGS